MATAGQVIFLLRKYYFRINGRLLQSFQFNILAKILYYIIKYLKKLAKLGFICWFVSREKIFLSKKKIFFSGK